jgi:prevent-host-death family protein
VSSELVVLGLVLDQTNYSGDRRPMTVMSVQEAQAHLSLLISRAQHGEEVVVARSGKPAVRLVPVEPAAQRTFGTVPLAIPDGFFFDPVDDEELAAWSS